MLSHVCWPHNRTAATKYFDYYHNHRQTFFPSRALLLARSRQQVNAPSFTLCFLTVGLLLLLLLILRMFSCVRADARGINRTPATGECHNTDQVDFSWFAGIYCRIFTHTQWKAAAAGLARMRLKNSN